MYAKRTDKNQSVICDVLRRMGAVVHDLSRNGKGVPDLLVGYNGVTVLVEVKSSDKAYYTPDQKVFMGNWIGGLIERINNVDEAVELIKRLKK